MTDKQISELKKVLNGEKYTKRWDFWATLSRQDIVNVHSKPAPNYGVDHITITEWGKTVLKYTNGGT